MAKRTTVAKTTERSSGVNASSQFEPAQATDVAAGTYILVDPSACLRVGEEMQSRWMPQTNPDLSVLAQLRDAMQSQGCVIDCGGMPLTIEEAVANPGKLVLIFSGHTRLDAALAAGVKVGVKVHPRVEPDKILELAVQDNLLRNELTILDKSAIIHRFEAMGKSRVEIRKILAPPGRKDGLMTEVDYIQHRKLMEFSDDLKKMIHEGRLQPSTALFMTNRSEGQIKQMILAVEKRRKDAIWNEAVARANYLKREKDESIKALLAGEIRPPAEIADKPVRQPRVTKVDAPISVKDAKEVLGAGSGDRSMADLKAAIAELAKQGGPVAKYLVECLSEFIGRKVDQPEFVQRCLKSLEEEVTGAADVKALHPVV